MNTNVVTDNTRVSGKDPLKYKDNITPKFGPRNMGIGKGAGRVDEKMADLVGEIRRLREENETLKNTVEVLKREVGEVKTEYGNKMSQPESTENYLKVKDFLVNLIYAIENSALDPDIIKEYSSRDQRGCKALNRDYLVSEIENKVDLVAVGIADLPSDLFRMCVEVVKMKNAEKFDIEILEELANEREKWFKDMNRLRLSLQKNRIEILSKGY